MSWQMPAHPFTSPVAGDFSNVARHIAATHPYRRPSLRENGPDVKPLF
jgi:hypothetical protein